MRKYALLRKLRTTYKLQSLSFVSDDRARSEVFFQETAECSQIISIVHKGLSPNSCRH